MIFIFRAKSLTTAVIKTKVAAILPRQCLQTLPF